MAKCPRSVFLNRASFPLALISRRMAEYKVACGVLPPGLVHKPFFSIASIISLQAIGSLASARTLAAAFKALSFLGLASLAGFVLAALFGAAFALADFLGAVLVVFF